MARVNNPLLIGMSGTIGELVFKTYKNGKTYVSKKQGPSKNKTIKRRTYKPQP